MQEKRGCEKEGQMREAVRRIQEKEGGEEGGLRGERL
jgi:hypothetical protein